MTRRDLLRAGAAASAWAMLARPSTALAAGSPVPLGVQLYTLRTIFPNDFMGVFDRLAAMGYHEVEFAGYHGRTAQVVRGALDAAGLAAPSAHVQLDELEQGLDSVLVDARVIGHRYLVIPGVAPERRRSLDDYRRLADALNAIGARSRAAGVQLAYHNHDAEFEALDGSTGYDVLLEATDASSVAMELDMYWMIKGGRDPLSYFQSHPGRFALWHLKDDSGPPDHAMADVGAGVIDWAALFASAELAGLRHAFVEHDEPGDPLRSVEASARFLQRLSR
jgi:sugar phosphate isomerase/epimerase